MSDPGTRTAADGTLGLLTRIADIGRDPLRGGYSRPGFSDVETELHEWFVAETHARGLEVETDRNGIVWAWWNPTGLPLRDAVVTGSHLDSVPGGGAYDGPLGVASALAAVDRLREDGHRPTRPVAIAVFPEEEGSRFGVACLGSRLLTGALDPARAVTLTDPDGISLADALRRRGADPDRLGPDPEALGRIGRFVELHVEQGRGLVDLGRPVALAGSVLGHGRWRLTVAGRGDHAGTTLMTDRADPMVAAARVVVAVRNAARAVPGARATVGRIVPTPGGTNVIASRVDLWLDARHVDDGVTAGLVTRIADAAGTAAAEEGCRLHLTEESLSPTVHFDPALTAELGRALPGAPTLDTGAGHDAAILARHVPSSMLFVRNPTGVSHSPEEHVDPSDVAVGATALASVLARLSGPADRPGDDDRGGDTTD